MFWLKYIKGLIQAFHGDISPNQLAAGFAMGMMIGLIPKVSLLGAALWLVVLFFRVQIGMATAAVLLFAMVSVITDPAAEKIGFFALTGIPALQGVWTALYNTPMIPFTAFNNTLVMGNFLLGLALFVPVFFAFRRFVTTYRTRYREKVMQWKVMQALRASAFYDLYDRWINR